MRPRPMTAENRVETGETGLVIVRFNEAAADDRGKPCGRTRTKNGRPGFNEAAADDRGKPSSSPAC